MVAFLTNMVRALTFALVSISGILSIYAATNAFAVYTNLDVFLSGILVILTGALAAPLFCYFAAYGMIFYSDRSAPIAVAIVLPVLAAWCVSAVRLLAQAVNG